MYSVITQFAKLAAGEQLCLVFALIENYSTPKPLKVSPEKSQILSCNTLLANEINYLIINTGQYETPNGLITHVQRPGLI
jgi:hypothetical protein